MEVLPEDQDGNVAFSHAYRANYLPLICGPTDSAGIGAEIGASFELDDAKRIAEAEPLVIYSGLGRSQAEFEQALSQSVQLVNVSSATELERLNDAARKVSRKAPTGICVHVSQPDMKSDEARQWAIFGLPLNDSADVFERASSLPHVQVEAIQVHEFQRCTSSANHLRALDDLLKFCRDLDSSLNVEPKIIDLGGGFDSRYEIETELEFIKNLFDPVKTKDQGNFDQKIWFECGRLLVNDAAIVLAQVTERRGRTLIVDAGSNLLIPLASSDYDVAPLSLVKSELSSPFVIKDKLCSTAGVIASNVSLPESISEGDILAVLNCGAYTVPLANRWMFPRPGIALLEASRVRWLHPPESVEGICADLFDY